jgi:hypothetical protein
MVVDDMWTKKVSGNQHLSHTTTGWKISILWKDVSKTRETINNIKASYPLQLAEFAVDKGIQDEPAFKWWAPHSNQLINNVKTQHMKLKRRQKLVSNYQLVLLMLYG